MVFLVLYLKYSILYNLQDPIVPRFSFDPNVAGSNIDNLFCLIRSETTNLNLGKGSLQIVEPR